ncbi:MAG: hypothetical protein JW726_06065 [Anaerolineales bacterium]|nr:hypothetical protein [Anaerolineales bacterium]
MSTTLDLKSIEQKAFRAIHQDGLMDISIGGVVLSFSILQSSTDSESFPLSHFALFLVVLLASQFIYWGGKKFLTLPRLGMVKFGPRRQRRTLTMMLVLAGIVFLQVLLVAGSIYLWNHPQVATSLGFPDAGPDRGRLLVAVIGALFVGPSTVLIAYFTDFLRGYYIAVVLSLAVFAMIWFSQPIFMIAGALLIIIPGVIVFIRFMREYPLPREDASHE